jgi:hypothetical protein
LDVRGNDRIIFFVYFRLQGGSLWQIKSGAMAVASRQTDRRISPDDQHALS